MVNKIKSEGECVFCGKMFSKSTIARHLNTHFTEKVKTEKLGFSYFLKITMSKRWGATPYFLYLWISDKTTLQQIDVFLRSIWLECCGHMSSFEEKKKKNIFDMNINFDDNEDFGIKMKTKVNKILRKDSILEYTYDFGSSTELEISVIDELSLATDKPIQLLSRNEPIKTLCESCKKESVVEICTAHGWEEDNLFCKNCAKKHAKICDDFDDYASMPFVNSPRMGVCAFVGGTIDVERN